MNWDNLLFLHWRVDPAKLRPLVPQGLQLDTFNGAAWIGLVPFRMAQCRLRGVPPLPGVANFYECNVRTYVTWPGSGDAQRRKAGVWFFSLDAQALLPVVGGRWMWSLNYIHSGFDVARTGDTTDYRLTRRRGPWPSASAHIRWRTGDPLPTSEPGTLNYFLTERYWLFTRRRGRIMAGEVRHPRWPLRHATLLHLDDSLVHAAGVAVQGEPIACASEHIEVEGYGLVPM